MSSGTPARRRPRLAAARSLPEDVRVGIYVRRSTDDEHQPYSIEAQDTRLTSYIDSQPGWRLVKRFHDDASGATTSRQGLANAMAAARAGLIDVLLVYRVDRFSRSLRDTVTLLDELDQAGVVFRSATEPFDTSTPMGRMLVQMLGMFAQFERDTLIDRVIAGMERKATTGKWMGGPRPIGYLVDPSTQYLVLHEAEVPVVRSVFELYAHDRLGSKAIAHLLNERGHTTSTGGQWSGHQVRTLTNRVYLGELTFRGITARCHPPLIDAELFEQAQRILATRSEAHAHRAASGSDYQLTGLMRCPNCKQTLIGTRAHGKTRVYRYYTCYSRSRYDSAKCEAPRINADALEAAVFDALGGFYRDQHQLIAEAIDRAQAQHLAGREEQRAELAAVEAGLARRERAIDRYLTAFENGTLDEELLAERLAGLRDKVKRLRTRRDELTELISDVPAPPESTVLREVADHIADVVASGTDRQRKSLVEALIAEIKITGPSRFVPVFRVPRVPQPRSADAPAASTTKSQFRDPMEGVRAMTQTVGREGLEPSTNGLKVRCSAN
jgi:site-specific DNA recombinase